MKAICPKDMNHDEFFTTSHVTQEWKVDSEGCFISVSDDCLEVTHGPDSDNEWVCAICGAIAEVIND